MTEKTTEDRLITGRRGLDIFLGVLTGLLVPGTLYFVFQRAVQPSGLPAGVALILFSVLFLLIASAPLLFRWRSPAFVIGYCGAIGSQCVLLFLPILNVGALFSGRFQISPLHLVALAALAICYGTIKRRQTPRT